MKPKNREGPFIETQYLDGGKGPQRRMFIVSVSRLYDIIGDDELTDRLIDEAEYTDNPTEEGDDD